MMMAAASSVQVASCRVTGARRGTVSRSAHAASSATARASGFVGGVRLPARAARRGAVSSGACVTRAPSISTAEERGRYDRARIARVVRPSRPANRFRPEIFTTNTLPASRTASAKARRPPITRARVAPTRHLANIRGALGVGGLPRLTIPTRAPPLVPSPPPQFPSRRPVAP